MKEETLIRLWKIYGIGATINFGGLMGELNFSPIEQKRFGYLEGREDLFQSKLLKILPENNEADSQQDKERLLVVGRDPGSAGALLPVVDILINETGLETYALVDGRAQDKFQGQLKVQDVTPETSLSSDIVVEPSVILVDASTESGLEGYANSTFVDVPMVLIEDMYSSSIKFLQAIKERPGFHLPEKICVIDEEAKRLIVEKFPDMNDLVVVTGQPSFDRISKENTRKISSEVREKLGLEVHEKLVSFMSTPRVTIEQAEKIFCELQELKDFKLIFRKHPRDNTSDEDYEAMLAKNGMVCLNAEGLMTDEVNCASDLVITTWSTEGLNAIYRRKPTIHILDSGILDLPESVNDKAWPPVKLGASVGIFDVNNLSKNVTELLDANSDLNRVLRDNMDRYYPNDGQNARRVADQVMNIIFQKKN